MPSASATNPSGRVARALLASIGGVGKMLRAKEAYAAAPAPSNWRADAFRGRGNAYAHKSEYDHAVQDYDQAIQLNPYDAIAFYNRGVAYQSEGQRFVGSRIDSGHAAGPVALAPSRVGAAVRA